MDKQYKVRVTPHAEQSLQSIGQYIAVQLSEPQIAVQLLRSISDAVKRLQFLPERIHLTPESPWREMGIRRMLVKNYYIYFWIDEQNTCVHITDIIYAKRDQREQLAIMPI